MKSIHIYRLRVLFASAGAAVLLLNIIGFYEGVIQFKFYDDYPNRHAIQPISSDHSKPASAHANQQNVPPTALSPLRATPSDPIILSRTTVPWMAEPPISMLPKIKRGTDSGLFEARLKHSQLPCSYQTKRDPGDGRWFNFTDDTFRLYAYTAFHDSRPSLPSPLVRVISLSSELVNDTLSVNKKSLFCVLHYREQIQSGESETRVRQNVVPAQDFARQIGFGLDLIGVKLKEYLFSCPLANGETSLPVAVTLVTSYDRVPTVTACVPIEDPPRPSVKENIAVCVQVAYGTLDPRRLIEWMELQRILGVKKVGVYDMHLTPGPGLAVLRHYASEGFVDLRKTDPIPLPGANQYLLHGTPAINDCMYRHMFSHKWIFVIDFDEVLLPKAHSNLEDMVSHLESITSGRPTRPVNFLFLNQYYFFNLPPDPDEPPVYTILRYRRKAPMSPQGYAMKGYVDPLTCAQMQNHYCIAATDGVNITDYISMFEFVEPSIGILNHYKVCHLSQDECRKHFERAELDDFMLKYRTELHRNVEEKLRTIIF